MKTCYIRKLSAVRIAILDCCPFENGFLITRVNVPHDYRGRGHASSLLRECTDSADAEQITLFLTIQPSDGLDYTQLEQFYTRHGFRQVYDNLYQRDPIGHRSAASQD